MLEGTASVTAKLCSFVRAYHCGHDRQRVFDDFLARDLMGDADYREMQRLVQGEFSIDCPEGPCSAYDTCPAARYYLSPILLGRAAFAEDLLQQFAQSNGACQYVICGAGLDTFFLRNANSNIRVFEIDHPDTGNYKMDRLETLGWGTQANATFVSVDFNRESLKDRLLESGFDPSVPSFFALLGVTYYLDISVFERTCRDIAGLQCPGSVLCFDFPDQSSLTSGYSDRIERLAHFAEKLGEPMAGGYQLADVAALLKRCGMSIDTYLAPAAIQSRYFEGSPSNLKAYESIHFISTVKDGVRAYGMQ